ncbi:ABC transporter permease [Gluconobacter kanchanaburiensis]|uniref:ABC transporter permease n=1 Tax=Gluconobacter kanchanaburiensis NBRC 103587 TaxID=1307948 RepID=A0A511BAW5_9PROT|nr:ABC transporter permease [Gluconobacter kanchanaburiensis]GBR71960.1 peptide ABC transporter permease [Gluconobacter kanchanaburiensis NBRC 103587]GEK96912.1 ABC transporter permease [Gluconobacter kanchanaburiensis NBRC 103587]
MKTLPTFRRNRTLWLGAALLGTVMLPALLTALLHGNHAPPIDVIHRYAASSASHPFGTDPFGRDLLVFICLGAFNSLIIAVTAVALATFVGTMLGLIAAMRPDTSSSASGTLIMGFADLGLAFPPVLIAALLVTALGASTSGEILAIALFGLPAQIRLTRQAARSILLQDYIAASRLAGRSTVTIMRLHVLPNILPLLMVQTTSSLALAILSDAGLSYLGLGAPPPRPDLGRALASYQIHIFDHPMLVAIPGLAIMLLVCGFNILGDGLRDALDAPYRMRMS